MDEKIKENLIYIRDNIKVDGILDMNDYGCLTGFNRKEVEENKCGTAGCALGWSALLPKFKEEVNNSFNSWGKFDYYIFDNQILPGFFRDHQECWEFLFGYMWEDYDNTIKGFKKRVTFLLDYKGDYNDFTYDEENFKEGWS